MQCTRALAAATCLLTMSLNVDAARADAVPPPPASCPAGQVGVTSHAGPECVPEAPKDCAPGYRGQVGGKCVLASCGSNDQCQDDERCMQVDTCQEYRELHWTGWGWSAQRPIRSGNFFGGPPRPRPPGPPKQAWVELNICGQDGPCASPAACRPSTLCYPTSAIGKTKAKVVEPGSDGPPSPSDTSSPAAATSVPTAGPDDRNDATASPHPSTDDANPPIADSGGCRKGCSTTTAATDAAWIGIPMWALAMLILRRGRRNRR